MWWVSLVITSFLSFSVFIPKVFVVSGCTAFWYRSVETIPLIMLPHSLNDSIYHVIALYTWFQPPWCNTLQINSISDYSTLAQDSIYNDTSLKKRVHVSHQISHIIPLIMIPDWPNASIYHFVLQIDNVLILHYWITKSHQNYFVLFTSYRRFIANWIINPCQAPTEEDYAFHRANHSQKETVVNKYSSHWLTYLYFHEHVALDIHPDRHVDTGLCTKVPNQALSADADCLLTALGDFRDQIIYWPV